MAISNMQQARQLRAGGGIMDLEPRQGFFLGKIAKKITRPLKKIAKSPLGKAAMLGAGAYFAGGGGLPKFLGGKGLAGFGSNALGKALMSGYGKFRGMPLGKQLLIGGGIGAAALPFLLGGGEEEEEVVETFEKTPGTITDIVSQARARAPSLRFLPQNAYTQAGFFNAAGGGLAAIPRAGYQMGGPTEDVMVENIDTQDISLFWQLTIKTIDDLRIVGNENLTLEMYIMQLIHLKKIESTKEISN